MRNIVFFDLETKYLADEVGGWRNIHKMEMSVAVTCSSVSGAFRHFIETQTDALVKELQKADLVVGFNVLRFDYTVLQPYTKVSLTALPTLDMLQDIHRQLGFRLSLDAVASATLNATKSADGIQAVRWYRQGKIDQVIAYCQRDVEVTRDVYEFGRQHGFVQYHDRRSRQLRQIPVVW